MAKIVNGYRKDKRDRRSAIIGFTLIEVLVVMAMIGILSAIAAPSWISFLNNQRLSSAQSRAFSTLRLAQSNAKRMQSVWQASFRNTPTISQYAIHPDPPSTTNKEYWDNLPWGNFAEGVRIVEHTETALPNRTTLRAITAIPEPDVYQAQFKPQGSVNGQLGKITFGTGSSDLKKCVIISTLLGAMRVAENSACD